MSNFKGTTLNAAPGRNPHKIGEVPGFPVGTRWPSRRELCDDGVHCSLSSGICGTQQGGATSVVLSGGYEDDVDQGYEFTYTGQGGQGKGLRDPGVKSWGKNNKQVEDQKWERGNKALQTSCREGLPVRVIRGHTLKSPWATAEGYQYDGLYDVVEAEQKRGKSGFLVCLFRFKRREGQVPLPARMAILPMRPAAQPRVRGSPAGNDASPAPSSASGSSRTGSLKRSRSEEAESMGAEQEQLKRLREEAKQADSLSSKLPRGYKIPKTKPTEDDRGEGPSRLGPHNPQGTYPHHKTEDQGDLIIKSEEL